MKSLKVVLIILVLGFGLGCSRRDNILANSVLAYLQKIQDGVIFSEGFENPNWLTAEGWTTLQGTPLNSQGPAKQGLFSFQCTGTSSTLSVIYKALNSNGHFFSGWFYDDPSQTTQPGPFITLQGPTSDISVGVRNSVSTTKYSYSTSAYVPNTASTVSRVLGWNKYEIFISGSSGSLLINGNLVASFSAASFPFIILVYINSGNLADTGTTFGYFDEIEVCSDVFATINNIKNSTQKVSVYDSSNNFLSSQTGSSGNQVTFSTSPTGDLPVSWFFEISDQNNMSIIQYRSPLMQINPGDIYVYQPCPFNTKVQDWQPKENDLINQNQSTSGVTETLFNGFKPMHTFTAKNAVGYAIKNKLNNFYAYCAQGFPFSMMIDNSNVGFGVLSAAPGNGAQSVSVMPTLSTNPNDNFTVGRQYRIFDAHGQRRQKVTLASKTSTTQLNFVEYLTQPFAQGDYICEDTFLPFLEIGGSPDGFAFTNGAYLWFDWAQSCQEFTSA